MVYCEHFPTRLLSIAAVTMGKEKRGESSLRNSVSEFAGGLIFAVTRLSLRARARARLAPLRPAEIRHGFFSLLILITDCYWKLPGERGENAGMLASVPEGQGEKRERERSCLSHCLYVTTATTTPSPPPPPI